MLCFILQIPLVNETAVNETAKISQLTASILGIILFGIGLFVLLCWFRVAWTKKAKFWHFVFWSPDATKHVFLRKCRPDPDPGPEECSVVYHYLDSSRGHGTKDWNSKNWKFLLKIPAVTLRGQLVNPYPWPLIIKGAEFSWKRFADKNGKYIPLSQRPASKWDDAKWIPKFIGSSILPEEESDQVATVGLRFKVLEEFRPITIDPRSKKTYELVFAPDKCADDKQRMWCSKKTKRICQRISPKPKWPRNVRKPNWPSLKAGYYKCSFTLNRDRLFGGDEKLDFICRIKPFHVEHLKMREKDRKDHIMRTDEGQDDWYKVADATKDGGVGLWPYFQTRALMDHVRDLNKAHDLRKDDDILKFLYPKLRDRLRDYWENSKLCKGFLEPVEPST